MRAITPPECADTIANEYSAVRPRADNVTKASASSRGLRSAPSAIRRVLVLAAMAAAAVVGVVNVVSSPASIQHSGYERMPMDSIVLASQDTSAADEAAMIIDNANGASDASNQDFSSEVSSESTVRHEAFKIIRSASETALGASGDTTGFVSSDGKSIVSSAIRSLAALTNAAQAAAQAVVSESSSLPAPSSPTIGVVSNDPGGYHEEATRIIEQASDNYVQKLSDEGDIDGAPDGLGRGRAGGSYLTCFELGGVQFDVYCCAAECGHCSGGGSDTADPCMERGDPFRNTAWGEANCCGQEDVALPSRAITASCASSGPPCKCQTKEICRPLPTPLQTPGEVATGTEQAGEQGGGGAQGQDVESNNAWNGMNDQVDADSPGAVGVLANNFNQSIFGGGPLGMPAAGGGSAASASSDTTAGGAEDDTSGQEGGDQDGQGKSGSEPGEDGQSGRGDGASAETGAVSGGGTSKDADSPGVGHEGLVKGGAADFSSQAFEEMDKKGEGKISAADIAQTFGNGEVGGAEEAAAKWWNACYLLPADCPHYSPEKAIGALIPWGNKAPPPPPPGANIIPDMMPTPPPPPTQVSASVPGANPDWPTGMPNKAPSRPGFQRDFAITDYADNGAKTGEGIVVDTSADYAFVGGNA